MWILEAFSDQCSESDTNFIHMPPRKRKRSNGASGIPAHPWLQPQLDAGKRAAGSDLLKHLLGMLAVAKINAKDFCVCCHYLARCEVPGGCFSTYAVSPDQASSGAYQRRLDKVLPSPECLIYVSVPSTVREAKGR